MSTVQGRLRIAVQKSGRLAERSLDLVRDAGLRVVKGNNELLYRIENYPIDLLRVRDDDIPTFVADGVCDLGIVGENVLEEVRNGGPNAEVVMPLGFGRCTLKIAVPPTLDYAGPQSLDGLRIATSYPKILRRFLNDRDVRADIVTMRGAVEVAPRLKLAAALDKHAAQLGKQLDVLVQVNVGREPQKSGVLPEQAEELLRAMRSMANLRVRGLMTLALFSSDLAAVRACFVRLRTLRDRVRETDEALIGAGELSMGMSGDFETAVAEGATCVRVGQAIFGARAVNEEHYWPTDPPPAE